MKTKILLALFVLIGQISCTSDDENATVEEPTCDSSNTVFNQLYRDLESSPATQEYVSMDTYTHAYSFEVSEDKVICSVGYQSLSNFNIFPYLIEIVDNTSNATLYSENSLFDSDFPSYVTTTPIQIEAGHSYTISRTQVNVNGDFGNIVGRYINGGFTFPVSYDNLSITGSSFYGSGNPGDDFIAIPYIDIVFQE